MNDLEDEREILMYLRHEAGHAFNYAYELYKTPEWRDLFGPFRRPYRDDYRPVPFSRALRAPHRRLVRAEAPGRGLRRDVRRLAHAAARSGGKSYRGWRRAGEAPVRRPHGAQGSRDARAAPRTRARPTSPSTRWRRRSPSSTSRSSSERRRPSSCRSTPTSPTSSSVSRAPPQGSPARGRPARARTARRSWTRSRTGRACRGPLVKELVEAIVDRVERARAVERRSACEREHLIEITAYATTLAMNYLTRGKFVQP